ncbi:MAG: hypothetical protein HY098_03865 [Nitrospinae bacterium]|nr:hypothetical protein [Nitrospinota bacterium]
MKKIAFILAVIAALSSSQASAELRKTEALVEKGEGAVAIEGGDYIDARQRAKEAALQNAMWKAVFALSSYEQVERYRGQISARIIDNSINFVHSFKFNDEIIDPTTGTYSVSLEASFFTANVASALEKIGLAVAEAPKAVVVFDDGSLGMITGSGFLLTPSPTENLISQAAEEAGLKAVNRTKLRALKKDDEIMKAVKGDPAAVKWLGGQFNAELVMAGSTSAAEAGGKITGTVALRIYNGRTGELLWGKEASETIESSNQSDKFRTIRLAAEKMRGLAAQFLSGRQSVPAQAPG